MTLMNDQVYKSYSEKFIYIINYFIRKVYTFDGNVIETEGFL